MFTHFSIFNGMRMTWVGIIIAAFTLNITTASAQTNTTTNDTTIQIGGSVQSLSSTLKLPAATVKSPDGAWSPTLTGTKGNDVFDAGKFGGTATMTGNGGNDVFYGAGKFIVPATGGIHTWISKTSWGVAQLPDGFKNLIYTEPGGSIYLRGNNLNNVIVALAPISSITGGKGNDTLVGFAGDSNTFIINTGDGSDAIMNFKTGSGSLADKVQLPKGIFADYNALKKAIAQVGSNAVLTFPTGEKLTFVGGNMSSFVAANFMMKAAAPEPQAGACGSASGESVLSAPANNLCKTGTPTAVSGSGPWTWSCKGVDGGADSGICTAPKAPAPINGSCGAANGTSVLSAPTGNLCTTGTATTLSGSGPWSWTCQGQYGGTHSGVCSAPKAPAPVNGTCGNSNGQSLLSTPSTGLCLTGTSTAITGTGPWSWTCKGSNGGSDSSLCTAIKASSTVNGTCGSANGSAPSSAPSGASLCSSGTATAVSGAGPWTWSCMGSGGGSNSPTCSASLGAGKLVNGLCGKANKVTNLTAMPESPLLCIYGTLTAPLSTTASSWTWTCAGANGGTDAVCNASLLPTTLDAVCGAAAVDGNKMPATGLCTIGLPSPITTTTSQWSWTCNGLNGGTSTSCVSNNLNAMPGQCGFYNGAAVPSAPNTDLCDSGTASAISGSGPWSWTCKGTGGAATASCSANVNTSCAGTIISARGNPTMVSPAIPQPSLPGDIVGTVLQNINKNSNARYHTFGQAFRKGQVFKTDSLIGRLNGKKVPVQLDALSTWPDGSVKMAALTVKIAICPGSELPMMVAKGTPDADMAVGTTAVNILNTTLNLTAAFDFVTLSTGARLNQTVDIGAALKAALADPAKADYWLKGPLVTQARVDIPMPQESFHLTADVSVFKDGDILADVQFNNDLGKIVPHIGEKKFGNKPYMEPLSYTVKLNLNGQQKTHVIAKQYQYQDWHTQIRSQGDAFFNVQHDIKYLISFGALLPYDLNSGVSAERFASSVTKLLIASSFGQPLAANGITRSMGMTGGRGDIGFTTHWNTIWIMTQDWQAAKVGMAQGDTGGAIPWNFKDQNGRFITSDLPIEEFTYKSGTKTLTYSGTAKEMWAGDSRCGNSVCLQNLPANTVGVSGWAYEDAHQPNLGYVPYLFTAQRWYLDRLYFQAAKSVTTLWPASRNENDDWNIITGAQRQIRGLAWSFREVILAAFIGKNETPEYAHFNKVVSDNLDYLLSFRPLYETEQGQTYGWWRDFNTGITDPKSWRQNIAPWQQDFMTAIISWSAFMGNDKAKQFIDWQRNWIAGRFDPTIPGYDPNDGCAYSLNTYSRTTGEPFKTWPEISASMIAEGKARGDLGCENGYYGRLGRASLGVALHLFPSDSRIKQGLKWLMNSKAGGISLATRQKEPTYNIEANYE